jgi:hypothetical protein
MPVINNEFDAYLESKAKADELVETEKHEQRRPNYFIDEQIAKQKKKEQRNAGPRRKKQRNTA